MNYFHGMERKSIICSFVMTVEEYKTTQVLARRLSPPYFQLGVVAFIIVLGLLGTFASKAPSIRDDPGYYLPLSIFVFLVFYLAYQVLPVRAFCGTRAFRRSDLYNLEITQKLSEEGLFSDDADTQALIKWSGMPRALETNVGFALFRTGKKKTFFWFPKHALSSPGAVDQCRALIQEHIKDFRRL
jgi:hypothetical protein